MQEGLAIKGYVQVWGANQKLLAEGSNLVVNSGLELLAQRIQGISVELPSLFKFGTSSASTLSTMTGLQGETIFQAQAEITRDGAELIWTWEGDYGNASSAKIGEIGIFNTAGTMLARFVPIPAFNLNPSAHLKITWKIKIGGY